MRLTRKNKMAKYGYEYIAPNIFDNFGEGCNKLGQLEDIEEELGIDLITLLEVLFYKRTYVEKWDTSVIAEDCIFTTDLYEFVKNYGKTWTLTKEELL